LDLESEECRARPSMSVEACPVESRKQIEVGKRARKFKISRLGITHHDCGDESRRRL
jgi:hypothetical protein